jgi:hypothetical protein
VAGQTCTGIATLTAHAVKRHGLVVALEVGAPSGTRALTVGAVGFAVPGGTSRVVGVVVGTVGTHLLTRLARLPAQLTVVGAGLANAPQAVVLGAALVASPRS